MPTVIDEEYLRFTFGDGWAVAKYDNHSDTRSFVGVVEGRKAVDFVGLREDVTFLIEVKDFRGFRIANKPKTAGELNAAIAKKVHDTLAGLVLTHRKHPDAPLWREALRACRTAGRELRVVVWLEDDALFNSTRPNGKSAAAVFTKALKSALAWFPGRVLVVNRQCNTGGLPDVTVTDLPGAAGHRLAGGGKS